MWMRATVVAVRVATLRSKEGMLLKGTGDIVPKGMRRVIEIVEIRHIDKEVFQVLEEYSNIRG
jgi:hypothetical protein